MGWSCIFLCFKDLSFFSFFSSFSLFSFFSFLSFSFVSFFSFFSPKKEKKVYLYLSLCALRDAVKFHQILYFILRGYLFLLPRHSPLFKVGEGGSLPSRSGEGGGINNDVHAPCLFFAQS